MAGVRVAGDLGPFAAGQFNRIAAVGHDTEPVCQIVAGQAIGKPITFATDVDLAEIAQALFDGVDA